MKKLAAVLIVIVATFVYVMKIREGAISLAAGDETYWVRTPRAQVWTYGFSESQRAGLFTITMVGKAAETIPGFGNKKGTALVYAKLPELLRDRMSNDEMLAAFVTGLKGQMHVTSEQGLGGDYPGKELLFNGKFSLGLSMNDVWGRCRMMIIGENLVMAFALSQEEGDDENELLAAFLDTFEVRDTSSVEN